MHRIAQILLSTVPFTVLVAVLPAWTLSCVNSSFKFYMPAQYSLWGSTLLTLALILGISGVFKGLKASKRRADTVI